VLLAVQEFWLAKHHLFAQPDSPMRNFMATKSGKRKPTHHHRDDEEPGKKFPNGISATVQAVVQSWIPLLSGDHTTQLSRPEFVRRSRFVEVYNRIAKKYGGVNKKPRTEGSASSMLNDITFGRHDLPYFKLRALAEFVELPTGLFVLFSQCVSAEREARDSGSDARAKCLEIITGIRRVADDMEARLRDNTSLDKLFLRRYDKSSQGLLPSVELLKQWSDLYNNRC
jgi:hypothetical protein